MPAGRVLLDVAVVEQMAALTDLPAGIAAFADSLFSQISRFASIKVTGIPSVSNGVDMGCLKGQKVSSRKQC